jgi:hypothetical protein
LGHVDDEIRNDAERPAGGVLPSDVQPSLGSIEPETDRLGGTALGLAPLVPDVPPTSHSGSRSRPGSRGRRWSGALPGETPSPRAGTSLVDRQPILDWGQRQSEGVLGRDPKSLVHEGCHLPGSIEPANVQAREKVVRAVLSVAFAKVFGIADNL